MTHCPCGSNNTYTLCCLPLHNHKYNANRPEQLMRSRYSAYALKHIDYLIDTIHPRVRHLHAVEDIRAWALGNHWIRLEILDAYENIVEFKAYFTHQGKSYIHHEISVFEQEKNKWYYVSGSFPKN